MFRRVGADGRRVHTMGVLTVRAFAINVSAIALRTLPAIGIKMLALEVAWKSADG